MLTSVVFLNILIITVAKNVIYKNLFSSTSAFDVNMASKCIWNVIHEAFKPNIVITVLNFSETKDAGNDIMTQVIKMFNEHQEDLLNAFEITNGTQSSTHFIEECLENCNSKNMGERIYTKYFKMHIKTKLYLVFFDNVLNFSNNLKIIESMAMYDATATFVLSYTNVCSTRNANEMAQRILKTAYDNTKYKTKLLLPIEKDIFELYEFNLFPENSKYCALNPMLTMINTCDRGIFDSKTYRIRPHFSQLNCTIRAVLLRYPPFVISANDGVDLKLLGVIETHLNVTFEKVFNKTPTWGYKEKNGYWTGSLQQIYMDPLKIGIGGGSVNAERLKYFTFSTYYFTEKICWVVPKAKRLADGTLILFIFTWQLWVVLFVLIVICGIFLTLCSTVKLLTTVFKTGENPRLYLKEIGTAIFVSVQVTISIPVSKLNEKGINRVMFIFYSLFIIIVGNLYRSSLINSMTIPKYKHQISTYNEIAETSMAVGGMSFYKNSFIDLDNKKSMAIYHKYNYSFETETYIYWLNRVKEGKTISIFGEYIVKYYDREQHLTQKDGTSNIHVITSDDELMFINSYGIIFSKNFVLTEQFNNILENLMEAGLINMWAQSYIRDDNRIESKIRKTKLHSGLYPNNNKIVLTLRHFQGAFMILGLGIYVGLCMFVLEHMVWKIKGKN